MKILIERDSDGWLIHKLEVDKTQNVNLTLSYIKPFSIYVGEGFFYVKNIKRYII